MPQQIYLSQGLSIKRGWPVLAVLALALGLTRLGLAAAPPPSELTVTCNGPVEGFNSGIPVTWTVTNNAPGNPVFWTNLAGSGEASNYTGGAGDTATASSDLQGGGSGLYNTELRTPPIDLSGWAEITLSYFSNYQNFATADFLNVDISTNGGSSWTNLLSWNEDHGTFRGTPGETVNINLSAYAGQPSVILRWHYFDPTGPGTAQDWYAQIDDVALSCVAPAMAESLVCNGSVIDFDLGLPINWPVINNAPGNPVFWTSVNGSGEAGNYTGGSGSAASASSDLQGGGSGLYDTELRTPTIDLTGFITATVSYDANYQNFALVDFLNLDVSTNGGASWTTVQSWNEDHGSFRSTPGEVVNVDLSAYAGQPNVLLRWHYFDPTGPADLQDWYAQVDNIALSCGFPAVDLTKTVGTDPNVCASSDVLEISSPTDVTYCYSLTNTGNMSLNIHDLADSELGTILSGFNFILTPGASVFLTQTATINATTVNTATWTVANPSIPGAVASDSASAAVLKIVDIYLPAIPKLSTP